MAEAAAPAEHGREPTRLAIISNDHQLTRQILQNMLADEDDIEIVGEAANGRQAGGLCSRLRPDLILMDVRMPEMDGLVATREVKERYPETSVMMLTMHENPDYLLEALKAGAAGYVLKDAPQDEIIEAVRRVSNGESPMDPELAARLLRRLASEGRRAGGSESLTKAFRLRDSLTPRGLEVLGIMKLGLSNREIAADLVISLGTAKNHVEHIMAKLGVSDRTQAVVKALELGILDFTDTP